MGFTYQSVSRNYQRDRETYPNEERVAGRSPVRSTGLQPVVLYGDKPAPIRAARAMECAPSYVAANQAACSTEERGDKRRSLDSSDSLTFVWTSPEFQPLESGDIF